MKKKNIFQIGMSALLMMFILVHPVTATGEEVTEASNKDKVKVAELSSTDESGIIMTVYKGNDMVVYDDLIPAGFTFEDAFDFSGVQQGTYRVVKQLDDINFIRIFKVEENGVVLPQSLYSFTPQFSSEEKLLSLKFMNSSQNQVRIEISDTWETVFEDYYRKPGKDLRVNYDLNSFPEGTYTLNLTTSQEEFSYEFKVE